MAVFNNALAGAAGQISTFTLEKSVRFNADDSANLSRTPSSAGSQQKFTLSTWVKRCRGGDASNPTEMLLAIDAYFGIYFYDDKIYVDLYPADLSSWYVQTITDAKFRDNSAWYHIVISVDSTAGSTNDDRIKIWVNGVLQTVTYVNAGGGSLISGNIARINTAVTHYIGMRNTQYPSSFYLADYYWIDGAAKLPTDFAAFDDNGVWQAKAYSGTFGTNGFHLFDFANESGIGDDSSGNNNDFTAHNLTESIPGITSPNRPTWNGSIGSYWTRSNSNYDADYSGTSIYRAITAALSANTTYHFYLNFKDGSASYGGWFFSSTASAPSNTVPDELGGNSLGLRTGESYLGTYGTYATANSTSNGQDKINVSALNTQSSGEYSIEFVINTTVGKVWAKKPLDSGYVGGGDPTNSSSTASFLIPTGAQYFGYMGYTTDTFANFKTTVYQADVDVLRDVPTNGGQSDTGAGGEVSGNYCTWNPLSQYHVSAGYQFLDQGNLRSYGQLNSQLSRFFGTQAVDSGKYYWELTRDAQSTDIQNGGYIEIGVSSNTTGNRDSLQFTNTNTSVGDVIGVALDKDNNTFQFYKNGVAYGSSQSIASGDTSTTPYVGLYPYNSYIYFTANFGQRPFAYSAPSGYKALCTSNLPTPTIADGSDYFDVVPYTGNSSTQDITGYSFEPDWVWIKCRSHTRQHMLYDQIRGEGKHILSDGTEAEQTNTNGLSDFISDGFSLGGTGQYVAEVNELNQTYVAWAWDGASSTATNTDGSVTSQVRANQTAGFSVCTFTSPSSFTNFTFGHGLNAVPEFVLVKTTGTTSDWSVYHASVCDTTSKYLVLNSGVNLSTFPSIWGSALPTSSVVGLNSGGAVAHGQTCVAYCFSPVENYSAFGSYDANSDADGPFVYTGFKVAWLMIKATSQGNSNSNTNWYIYDAARDPNNPNTKYLQANLDHIEGDFNDVDLLSNGFKLRNLNDAANNTTRDPYIYIAFAENPFQANGGLAS